jgi:hypothetical protein
MCNVLLKTIDCHDHLPCAHDDRPRDVQHVLQNLQAEIQRLPVEIRNSRIYTQIQRLPIEIQNSRGDTQIVVGISKTPSCFRMLQDYLCTQCLASNNSCIATAIAVLMQSQLRPYLLDPANS